MSLGGGGGRGREGKGVTELCEMGGAISIWGGTTYEEGDKWKV